MWTTTTAEAPSGNVEPSITTVPSGSGQILSIEGQLSAPGEARPEQRYLVRYAVDEDPVAVAAELVGSLW